MKTKLMTLIFALCALNVNVFADGNLSLTHTLKDLRSELQMAHQQRTEAQQRFNEDYDQQHQKMIGVFTESNELSILLYTQRQEKTFDMAYALKKVTRDYKSFAKNRRPYDHIIGGLSYEIDRYARLIEALRRLPPEMKEIEVEIVPDSLQYRNDSLDLHMSQTSSSLEKEIIRIAIKDSVSAPFVLDSVGEQYRDSCIFFASELLKMFADNRAVVISDSTHYQEVELRTREAFDYAAKRYQELGKYVFSEGQTPYITVLGNLKDYWNKTLVDLRDQYNFAELHETSRPTWTELSPRGKNARLVRVCLTQLVSLSIVWFIVFCILVLLWRYTRLKNRIQLKSLSLFAILLGTVLYFPMFSWFWTDNEYAQLGANNLRTFLWLLIVISGSLLLRIKSNQIWYGLRLYIPSLLITLLIIICRNIFIPDKLLNLLFPPILFFFMLWQLYFCLKERGKAAQVDSVLGWMTLLFFILAFVISFFGYTMAALLDLVWAYFQLAVLLTVLCISDLLDRYKERRLDKRVAAMREQITYVTGDDRESLLFRATWYHDLIRQVGIPTMLLLSFPLCIYLALKIFDFNDMFVKLYESPFINFIDENGVETLRISVQSLVNLLILFFVLRYLNRAIHTLWQYSRYRMFMHKNKRTHIRANEINLSLGNSIISVLVWTVYMVIVIVQLKIPTGSLGLIAGGLSAGIGIALKDIINNFVYGIQLMGGRLRVGDWIECEGVRGRVVAINYQCVQVETIDGTEMSFLNASLFGKNFNNLTRNNSYEFTKIIVGVAYGTDVKRVREVLVEAMQQVRTKDHYGRDIVDPKKGVYVVVDNMSDSSVDIAVKQYVLVAERIGYVDRAKEVIYDALNAAGISIPFPQCDVHLVKDSD
ncbi:MAG: mechanosensitive ion channel family protein [Paludibacteraceae bacterium]|nr:mechanosensitive ion channel family protein [Paludibacteraceae bacterium]